MFGNRAQYDDSEVGRGEGRDTGTAGSIFGERIPLQFLSIDGRLSSFLSIK